MTLKKTISERGFEHYSPLTCSYRSTIRVYQSSSATRDALWLDVEVDPNVLTMQEYGTGTAHLTVDNVKDLRDQLNDWLEEVGENDCKSIS